jgi:hypothetical protein
MAVVYPKPDRSQQRVKRRTEDGGLRMEEGSREEGRWRNQRRGRKSED